MARKQIETVWERVVVDEQKKMVLRTVKNLGHTDTLPNTYRSSPGPYMDKSRDLPMDKTRDLPVGIQIWVPHGSSHVPDDAIPLNTMITWTVRVGWSIDTKTYGYTLKWMKICGERLGTCQSQENEKHGWNGMVVHKI